LLNEAAARLREGIDLSRGRHRDMIGDVECEFRLQRIRANAYMTGNFPILHTRVFRYEAVNQGTEEIPYVSHGVEDGVWQFLGDSMSGGLKPVISCFQHPVDKDPSLKELADLPLGWCGERVKPGDPWIRHQHESESTLDDE